MQLMGVLENKTVRMELRFERWMWLAIVIVALCVHLEACVSSATIVEEPSREQVSCSLGMVGIPAGEFFMGCKHGEDKECMSLEGPWQKVDIERAYCIDRTEVTNEQYLKCVQAGDCHSIYDVQCGIFHKYIDHPVARFIGGRVVDYVDVEGHEGVS